MLDDPNRKFARAFSPASPKGAIALALAVTAFVLMTTIVPSCKQVRSTLPAAQRALADVQFYVNGDAALASGVSSEFVAVYPAGTAALELWLPVVGKAWQIDTARHPGPWTYRVVLSEDSEGRWVELVPATEAEIAAGLPHLTRPPLSEAQPLALGVQPALPAMPRMRIQSASDAKRTTGDTK